MKKYLMLFFILTSLVGCNSWLDVNKDPNNPQDVPMALLLPTVEFNAVNVVTAGSATGGLGEDLGVYTHQLTTRENANVYNANGNEYFIGQSWDYMYNLTLQNCDVIIDKAIKTNASYYAGIGLIIKAYMFSQYVDVFGDIPFSQANKKSSGILYPRFDKSADIYPQLIALLDSGIVQMKKAKPAITPGADDLIFGGEASNWIKTANTIKLKLYTQTYAQKGVDKAALKTKITALLATPAQLIGSTEEGFMFPFTSSRTPDNRNPAYVGTYEATQKTTNMSPWFYEILKGINPVFQGIVDPRIPYYFYNQLTKTGAGKDASPSNFEYRDGGFVSIYFGSNGPDNGRALDKSNTVYGIYPCGGRYDEGDALTVDAKSGTGAAPYRFLTYADRLFLEAELIQAGIIPGDARAKLSDAMTEAFKLVDYVVGKANGGQKIPSLTDPKDPNSANTTAYITAILGLFDAGNSDKKMEIIMTEKWISSFGNHVDQYTDYRRTGYPVMFNPGPHKNGNGIVVSTVTPPAGGDPERTAPPVPVSCSLLYPRSLAWSINDLNVNKNAPKQKTDVSIPFVFWDPNL
ncbi:MAG: SusD/RagB family nutrient-binding outer membrane lipoprotein [Bacteroidota bacterium]|nr:SusD/RagB family nutrient-binding outer membrane lipoprotein [Bacteroidota bacterium]